MFVDVTAEVPVVGLAEKTAISGQMDRVLVTDDEVLVVDYKTNRPPPQRVEDVPAIYLKQMAAYQGVLSRIYPRLPVRCALLWTDACRLMALPDALLAPYLAKLDRSDVMTLAEQHGILAAPVVTPAEALRYDHLATERGFWDSVDGRRVPGLPFLVESPT